MHAGVHHLHLLVRQQLAVNHADVRNDATVGVVDGVKDQGAGWRIGVVFG